MNLSINSDKYILQFGKIHLAIWTNMRATSMWPSNPGSKQTENTLIFQHMPNPPKWICHGHDGVLSDFNVSQLRQMMRMAKFKEKLSQISVFLSNLKYVLLFYAEICRFQESSNWISLSCHWIQVVSLQLCLRGIKIQYKDSKQNLTKNKITSLKLRPTAESQGFSAKWKNPN